MRDELTFSLDAAHEAARRARADHRPIERIEASDLLPKGMMIRDGARLLVERGALAELVDQAVGKAEFNDDESRLDPTREVKLFGIPIKLDPSMAPGTFRIEASE